MFVYLHSFTWAQQNSTQHESVAVAVYVRVSMYSEYENERGEGEERSETKKMLDKRPLSPAEYRNVCVREKEREKFAVAIMSLKKSNKFTFIYECNNQKK